MAPFFNRATEPPSIWQPLTLLLARRLGLQARAEEVELACRLAPILDDPSHPCTDYLLTRVLLQSLKCCLETRYAIRHRGSNPPLSAFDCLSQTTTTCDILCHKSFLVLAYRYAIVQAVFATIWLLGWPIEQLTYRCGRSFFVGSTPSSLKTVLRGHK